MKFMIEQKKLKEILGYVMVDGIFPYASLSIINKTLEDKKGNQKTMHCIRSIQETTEGAIFRFVEFDKEYFKSLSKEPETINFDAALLHKIISRESPEQILTIQTKENRLIFDGKSVHVTLNMIDSSIGGLEEFPFMVKKGVPIFNKGATPLANQVEIGLKAFKEAVSYAGVLETDFLQLKLDEHKRFTMKLGDLEGYSQTAVYSPKTVVKSYSEPVDVVLTKAFKELSNTFARSIGIMMKTGYPTWFYETSERHKFGVLVAPRQEGEEEETKEKKEK